MRFFMKSESIVKRSRELENLSLAILISMLLVSCGSEGDENNSSSQTNGEAAVWGESNWGETRWQ